MADLGSVHHLHHPPLPSLSQSLAAQFHAVVDVDSRSLMDSVRLDVAAQKLWDSRWLLSSARATRTGVSPGYAPHLNGTAKPTNPRKSPGHATTLSLQDQLPGPEALPNKGLT